MSPTDATKEKKRFFRRLFNKSENKTSGEAALDDRKQVSGSLASPPSAVSDASVPDTRHWTPEPQKASPDAPSKPLPVLTGSNARPDIDPGSNTEFEDADNVLLDIGGSGSSETKAVISISELWDEAYEELAKGDTTKKLITKYESIFKKTLGVSEVPSERGKRREQMQEVTRKKTEQIENETWKADFLGKEFKVKDFVDTTVAASPLASIAWAGVGLLLSLLLNSSHQDASHVEGLDNIASIIRECSVREAIYHSRYESGTAKAVKPDSSVPHVDYKETIKDLYGKIITFQATYVAYLSENTAKRGLQDASKWKDWDSMSNDIAVKNIKLQSMDILWRDHMQQEEWQSQVQKHKENKTWGFGITWELL